MKVSAIQVDAGLSDVDERFNELDEQVMMLVDQGVELVLFPELYSSGYNKGAALHERAEDQNGDFATRVRALAKRAEIAILYGYPERQIDQVYNSALLVGSDGEILLNHRKTILPDGIEQDWFETGTGVSTFKIGATTCAVLICYESEFPEAVRSVCAAGAEVLFVPTACGAGWGRVPNSIMPARAFENGVFIVYANYCGEENGHGFCGQSCIIDPFGNDLARAGQSQETIVASLDLDLVREARERLPYLRDHLTVRTRTNIQTGLHS